MISAASLGVIHSSKITCFGVLGFFITRVRAEGYLELSVFYSTLPAQKSAPAQGIPQQVLCATPYIEEIPNTFSPDLRAKNSTQQVDEFWKNQPMFLLPICGGPAIICPYISIPSPIMMAR